MTSNKTQSATPPHINITPIILAGGKGQRLRPLTSATRPKHLLKFCSRHSFLQRTLLRVPNMNPPIIVCEERHITATQKHIYAIGRTNARIIAEPEGKSTAIAIALAANLLKTGTMLVLPCDHAIKNDDKFEQIISTIATIDLSNKIILFGAPITKPCTRFGYIKSRAIHPILNTIDHFIEKPNKASAQSFVKAGNYLWNTGIFLTTASHIFNELQTVHPEITTVAQTAGHRLKNNILTLNEDTFATLPTLSIDRALMEKTKSTYITNLGLKWSDTGTWPSLISSKFSRF